MAGKSIRIGTEQRKAEYAKRFFRDRDVAYAEDFRIKLIEEGENYWKDNGTYPMEILEERLFGYKPKGFFDRRIFRRRDTQIEEIVLDIVIKEFKKYNESNGDERHLYLGRLMPLMTKISKKKR